METRIKTKTAAVMPMATTMETATTTIRTGEVAEARCMSKIAIML